MTRLVVALLLLPIAAHAADCKPPNVVRVAILAISPDHLRCPVEGVCWPENIDETFGPVSPILMCLTPAENAAAEARAQ